MSVPPFPLRCHGSCVPMEAQGGGERGRGRLANRWVSRVPFTLNLVCRPFPGSLSTSLRTSTQPRGPCSCRKGPARQMGRILTLLSSKNFSAFAMLFNRKMRWDEDLYSWS